jgi:hypothetical protein
VAPGTGAEKFDDGFSAANLIKEPDSTRPTDGNLSGRAGGFSRDHEQLMESNASFYF